MDIELDKQHPEKRNRPLASGAIGKKTAIGIFVLLIVLAIGFTFCLQNQGLEIQDFATVIISYFVINILYTFKLKHVAIVDICIIATGFVLRVLAGGYITGIVVSQWAILLTFILALVLAIGKEEASLSMLRLMVKPEKLWMVIMFSLPILLYLLVVHWRLYVI